MTTRDERREQIAVTLSKRIGHIRWDVLSGRDQDIYRSAADRVLALLDEERDTEPQAVPVTSEDRAIFLNEFVRLTYRGSSGMGADDARRDGETLWDERVGPLLAAKDAENERLREFLDHAVAFQRWTEAFARAERAEAALADAQAKIAAHEKAWRMLHGVVPTKEHHPVGAYLPVGQLDGDCSCGRGFWPCRALSGDTEDGGE